MSTGRKALIRRALGARISLFTAEPLAALRRMVHKTPAIAAEPVRVALAVTHALEARRPRTRYRVGLDSRAQYYLRRLLPDRVRDWLGRKVMGI